MPRAPRESQPRILTFNFHEPYMCLMARTGLDFDLGLYDSGPMAREWHDIHRPRPVTMRPVPESAWRDDVIHGRYDVVIAHNESNALDLLDARCARLLVCHNRLTYLKTTVMDESAEALSKIEEIRRVLAEEFHFIFISDSKRADYGLPGTVILPGIPVEEMGGYTGDEAKIIRVGNMMRERDWMFDTPFQEAVCNGLPNRIAGLNPKLEGSRPAASYQELLDLYRRCRCMLHVTRQEFEDGYNLALLEAMACGMPAVSLANRTSPITDGVDGFVSFDPAVLRMRLEALLADRDLAREIGARGRDMVARRFPIEAFTEKWRDVIFTAADDYAATLRSVPRKQAATDTKRDETPRLRMLLHYVSSPTTTGRYFDQAASRVHDVITTGFRVPKEVLDMWGFPKEYVPYPPHRIALDLYTPYVEMVRGFPRGYYPDAYFWVDSGLKVVLPDIQMLDMPKLAYMIDTHVSLEDRMDIARNFDCVFLAQKAQVAAFKAGGIEKTFWVPLACSPELHNIAPLERIHDVAYVGSFAVEEVSARRALIESVAAKYPRNFVGKAWPHGMARLYAQTRIVVNACVNRDVNMRVFEAMASGAMLLTDEADGLEDLFEDGKHLVIYRSADELFALLEKYLADDAAREKIAAAGREYVLREHTYDTRFKTILELAEQHAGLVANRNRAPKLRQYYENARAELLQHVPLTTRRLLDVGCGAGVFGSMAKVQRKLEEVVGIEVMAEAWGRAREKLDQALLMDIEDTELPFEDGHFDCITCADVLEHLVEPGAALRKLARVLAPEGVVVISIPNARYHAVVQMLGAGAWTYMDAGITDRTHLRFFTRATLHDLVAEAGLEPLHIGPLNISAPDRVTRRNDTVTLGSLRIAEVSETEFEEFLTYQYVVVAGKPGVDRLARAREALDRRNNELAYALAVTAPGADECERHAIMAKALARAGKLDDAEREYRAALEKRGNPYVEGELGILLTGLNRIPEARPLLERALENDPDFITARAALGLCLISLGDTAGAFDALRIALEADFANLGLVRPFIIAANALGRNADAIPLVESFVDFYPVNAELLCDYAELLNALGRRDAARDRLETVLIFAPDNERAKALLEILGA